MNIINIIFISCKSKFHMLASIDSNWSYTILSTHKNLSSYWRNSEHCNYLIREKFAASARVSFPKFFSSRSDKIDLFITVHLRMVFVGQRTTDRLEREETSWHCWNNPDYPTDCAISIYEGLFFQPLVGSKNETINSHYCITKRYIHLSSLFNVIAI